jgi:DNA-binding beta-propeller fold protein YncE
MMVTGKRLFALLAVPLIVAVPRLSFDQPTLTVPAVLTLPVGEGPEGVVFDGAHIWVANQFSNSLTKIALAGLNVQTFRVGRNPIALGVDAGSIWVANLHGNSVTKVNPADGAVIGTFPVGR